MKANTRFIPVCSGNASKPFSTWIQTAVYPRVFGERMPPPGYKGFEAGLSPCVRGTLALTGTDGFRTRFIPVCSGNAPYPTTGVKAMTVYPRVFGERANKMQKLDTSNGLSPCVRGTLYKKFLFAISRRFIPVCSGNAN